MSEDWSKGAMEIIGVNGPDPQIAPVAPGGLTSVNLTVVNRASEPNLFTVSVEGEEGEWATVQPATGLAPSVQFRPNRDHLPRALGVVLRGI